MNARYDRKGSDPLRELTIENRHIMQNKTTVKRHLLFIVMCLVSVLVNFSVLWRLVAFSLNSDIATHIIFIPLVSAALMLRNRARIFSCLRASNLPVRGFLITAFSLLILGNVAANRLKSLNVLSLTTAVIVVTWIGAFVLSYGVGCFRRACFPLLFLIFMIPIPEGLLQTVISALQIGSAETTEILFKLTHTPFYRDGISFVLPRINIEIAAQCSSIRSSLALLISCSLAAHLILRTVWRKTLFVIIAVPMAMVKNGIRIAVLSLLSIHIDKRFIVSSDLHHEGGIVFFVLALLLLWPILWILRRSEKNIGLTAENAEGAGVAERNTATE